MEILKAVLFLAFGNGIGAFSVTKQSGNLSIWAEELKWDWFTQKVDNFNPQDDRTWKMRFKYDGRFFRKNGPIILLVGGEWDISDEKVYERGFEIANRTGGYVFYPEHRFYGKSFPTEDLSVANLRFLSVEQTLEDFARFVSKKKELSEFRESSVLAIGGSYGGTLATWLRIKFPHIVDFAYASGAPLKYYLDFSFGLLEVKSELIRNRSEGCAKTINEAFHYTDYLLNTPRGAEEVIKAYNVCDISGDVLRQKQHRAYFFHELMFIFFDDNICSSLNNTLNGREAFEEFVNYYKENRSACVETYDNFLEKYQPHEIPNSSRYNERQWKYQLCTEFANFHTTNSDKQIMGKVIPLSFHLKICKDLYGFSEEMPAKGVKRTNFLYGADRPEASYVLSVHGTHDYWSRLAIQSNLSELLPVIYVEGGKHCEDLEKLDEKKNSPQMIAAKHKVMEILTTWLKR